MLKFGDSGKVSGYWNKEVGWAQRVFGARKIIFTVLEWWQYIITHLLKIPECTHCSLMSSMQLGRQGLQCALETELLRGFDLRDTVCVKEKKPPKLPISFVVNLKLFWNFNVVKIVCVYNKCYSLLKKIVHDEKFAPFSPLWWLRKTSLVLCFCSQGYFNWVQRTAWIIEEESTIFWFRGPEKSRFKI